MIKKKEKERVEDFADYVLSIHIDGQALCPHSLWSVIPIYYKRITNEPKAFHSHYNEQFYVSYPSMFVLLDILTKNAGYNIFHIKKYEVLVQRLSED